MGFSRNSLVGIFAVCLIACNSGDAVPGEFVRLYGDLRVAEREFGEATPDGRLARVQILKRYGWTAERFDSMAAKIQKDPQLWEPFQDSVVAYVDSVALAAGAITRSNKPFKLPANVKVPKK